VLSQSGLKCGKRLAKFIFSERFFVLSLGGFLEFGTGVGFCVRDYGAAMVSMVSGMGMAWTGCIKSRDGKPPVRGIEVRGKKIPNEGRIVKGEIVTIKTLRYRGCSLLCGLWTDFLM